MQLFRARGLACAWHICRGRTTSRRESQLSRTPNGGLMLRRRSPLMALAAACAGVVAFAPLPSRAATATFDNGGADGGLWSNNLNWNPDGPVADTDVKFDTPTASTSATAVTNIVDTDISALTLHYKQFAAAANSYHTTQINDGKTL